jgi:hypothetical protein
VSEPRCAIAVAIVRRRPRPNAGTAGRSGTGRPAPSLSGGLRRRAKLPSARSTTRAKRFSDMQADLDRERKTMMRLWAKREEQIRGVVASTAGLYGNLQGIAGRSLLEIDGLELPLLDGPAADAAE